MAVHETHAIALTLEADAVAPAFLPLLDLTAGTTLLASQCALTLSGVPSPLEVAVMLCQPGTPLGDPGAAVLYVSDVVSIVADEPVVLPGSIPALTVSGVLGLSVPVQTLTAGATVAGTLSTVR
jgi:hypothetical protein